MTGKRSTTAPEPGVPAGEPQPTPIEEVPPTREPEPQPHPAQEAVDAGQRGIGALLTPRDQWDAEVRSVVREELDNGRERWPLSVGEAIAEVTRRVGAIAKEGQADQRSGGYRFRGIDQVLEALHPILGDVGLVLMPGEVREARFETRATSGASLNVARLLVRFRMIGPDGTETFGEAWGEGGDTGDKATQKAHSQAYKSFALQTFSIPTQQSAEEEPDATNPASRPFTEDEVGRAQIAWKAARDATTFEALAGVRHRALHLLDVPVPTGDGGLAPLSVALDMRRAELDNRGAS